MPQEANKLNTITENWLLLNVVWYILLSVATLFVMWYYSEKNLPWHIRISVFIALGASLSIVIMVPWDVSNVYQQRCQNATFTAIMNGKEPSCPSEITTITKVRLSALHHQPSVALVTLPCRSPRQEFPIFSTYRGTSSITSRTRKAGSCCRCSKRIMTPGSSPVGAASVKL